MNATTIDISEYLNVSSLSVTKMVKKLVENHIVFMRNTGVLSLHLTGISIAQNICKKHSLFAELLKVIEG